MLGLGIDPHLVSRILPRPAFVASAAAFCLALSACALLPGVPRTQVLSREPVTVGGAQCTYVARLTETNTTNGIHRYESGTISCAGRDYDCDQLPRDTCAAALAAQRNRAAHS